MCILCRSGGTVPGFRLIGARNKVRHGKKKKIDLEIRMDTNKGPLTQYFLVHKKFVSLPTKTTIHSCLETTQNVSGL